MSNYYFFFLGGGLAMEGVAILLVNLVYYGQIWYKHIIGIWYILWAFGIFFRFGSCTKKNLAALMQSKKSQVFLINFLMRAVEIKALT
jgi:hypothetical protein